MKRFFPALVAFAAILSVAGASRGASLPSSEAVQAAIALVKPSLVRIHVVSTGQRGGREVKGESFGSGVIVSPEGHVVTNHHVAGNAKQLFCTLSSREEVEADLVATDSLTDIAVIKLRNPGRRKFPAARFGDSSALRVGDPVLAMGSPLALSQSVTMGIVSNTEIVFPRFMGRLTLEGEDVGSIVRWIGHDAVIFGGNSGGPLVNLEGGIVGINEVNLGLSGAIPGNLAKEVADRLIRSGKVTRSWIGLDVQPLTGDPEKRKGALVSGAVEGSPAGRAGIRAGDVLLSFDGQPVTVRFPEEIPLFNRRVMDVPVGKTVEVDLLRDGKPLVLRVTTEEREEALSKAVEFRHWGITGRTLSRGAAREMKREARGVVVTTVRQGGPAWQARPKLYENDVIVEAGGREVTGVESLVEATKSLVAGRKDPQPVLVTFERRRERIVTVVRLEEERESQDQGIEARKAWLPAATQPLAKEAAAVIGSPGGAGFRVTQIYPGHSAEKAGLRVGDVIVALDGEKVPPTSSDESDGLSVLIRQYRIGTVVPFSIRRDGAAIDLSVTLEASPTPPGEMRRYRDGFLDFRVRDVAFIDRAQEGWDERRPGVLVETVGEGGWAALGDLAVGDLIDAVDGQPVADVAAFEKAMVRIRESRQHRVVLRVLRGIHTMFIELEPSWNGST
ncbi:MAG TPA: PDZ domain-containing protein [Candidatus Deferrimicrobiaceae bacterium]